MRKERDPNVRMKELIQILEPAARAYYQESREIMDNREYDAYYDELVQLEKETKTVLAGSPTMKVGYEVVSELPKEVHESRMLSLDKTKDVAQLQAFLGEQTGILSWKMDGLTVVLTYENGRLQKAVTRGNGEIGEVITNNASTFVNLPLKIAFEGRLVIRGEAVIRYSDFRKLNATIEEEEARYKNPRNLCSGSVRQLNSEITAKRNVHFFAFSLIMAEGEEFDNSCLKQFEWLQKQGFEVVEYEKVTRESLPNAVEKFAEKVEKNDVPSDGLVLLMDDIAYGESLGTTAKFPRNAMAFKWKDELAKSVLRYIEWSASRTGLINPVAVFDPVELEGTTVKRASVHNLSIMEELELGEGDQITVFKSNMIIPQIAENLTRSGKIHILDTGSSAEKKGSFVAYYSLKCVLIPDYCPVCGGKTEIRRNIDVKSLYCINPDCQAKKIKAFELFVSRDAMNIDGLSSATMEKLIDRGFIKEYADIFHLEQWKDAIIEMEGFGEKSYQNMIASIEKSRKTTLPRLIYSLGIPGIGAANAKMLSKAYAFDFERMRHSSEEELVTVDGIGAVLAKGWTDYFSDSNHNEMVNRLLNELEIEIETTNTELILEGKIFVITGSVHHFANRNELKAYIEERGGRVTGSVSAKTNYLINNDVSSNSSKNKKARDLEIPILSEEQFLELVREV